MSSQDNMENVLPEETADMLVVTSKVKKLVKSHGLQTSMEAVNLLSKKIETEVLLGIEKAKNDRRKTLMARDL